MPAFYLVGAHDEITQSNKVKLMHDNHFWSNKKYKALTGNHCTKRDLVELRDVKEWLDFVVKEFNEKYAWKVEPIVNLLLSQKTGDSESMMTEMGNFKGLTVDLEKIDLKL